MGYLNSMPRIIIRTIRSQSVETMSITFWPLSAELASPWLRKMSVFVKPGQTRETYILPANSTLSASVKPLSAAFEAEYIEVPARVISAAEESIFITAGVSDSRRVGRRVFVE